MGDIQNLTRNVRRNIVVVFLLLLLSLLYLLECLVVFINLHIDENAKHALPFQEADGGHAFFFCVPLALQVTERNGYLVRFLYLEFQIWSRSEEAFGEEAISQQGSRDITNRNRSIS